MKRRARFFLMSGMSVAMTVTGLSYSQSPDSASTLAARAAALAGSIKPFSGNPDFFPIVTQFSPVPDGKGWKGEEGPLSEQVLRDTVDNIIEHGFTGIESGVDRPEDEKAFILNYAQSRGMVITHHAGALELFGRNTPPDPSVYSPEYAPAVRDNAVKALATVRNIPRLYNVFTYQDEPFHWGPGSFGHGVHEQRVFMDRYGYSLPFDVSSIRNDPVKWLDFINFNSDNFPVGWRQVYGIIKEIDPRFIVTLTHDSHNTFGAGYGSHAELAIDDVFHWGSDFSDMFVYDIYPYMMIDFRFGEPSRLPLPRMSQTHYTFAQMRNLTTAGGKSLGFWVGTYNPKWFKDFMGEEVRTKYWSEQEMSMTVVAQGANYLLTGYHIPVDARHWNTFGAGNRLIQKTGGDILKTGKVKAKACMLFPRTQYIQMQEEYYDVGLSFELFLRAFGELDIIHEEQIVDDTMNGYDILVMFDVKLLPRKTAAHIQSFVRNGGGVIADCVPVMDEYKKPLVIMNDLFGVTDAGTGRIVRTGHWVNTRTKEPYWDFRGDDAPDESVFETEVLKGRIVGQPLDMILVSPRPCRIAGGTVLAETSGGNPAVTERVVGKGRAYLLGFCVQDTYFKTWQDGNARMRKQLLGLLRILTERAGIIPHVWSSNPAIEAVVRTGNPGGFLFVINHEADSDTTTVKLSDIGFAVVDIVDVETDVKVPFSRKDGIIKLQTTASRDKAKILRIVKK